MESSNHNICLSDDPSAAHLRWESNAFSVFRVHVADPFSFRGKSLPIKQMLKKKKSDTFFFFLIKRNILDFVL